MTIIKDDSSRTKLFQKGSGVPPISIETGPICSQSVDHIEKHVRPTLFGCCCEEWIGPQADPTLFLCISLQYQLDGLTLVVRQIDFHILPGARIAKDCGIKFPLDPPPAHPDLKSHGSVFFDDTQTAAQLGAFRYSHLISK